MKHFLPVARPHGFSSILAVLVPFALLAAACSHASDRAAVPHPKPTPPAAASAWHVETTYLNRVQQGVLGPYLAQNGGGSLALFASPIDGQMQWVTAMVPFGGRGGDVSIRTLGRAPSEIRSMKIDGRANDFRAAWIESSGRASTIQIATVSWAGEWSTPPRVALRVDAGLLFAQLVGHGGGDLLVWAVENPDDRGNGAELWGMPIDELGGGSGPQVRIAKRALAWQVVDGVGEAWLAYVAKRDAESPNRRAEPIKPIKSIKSMHGTGATRGAGSAITGAGVATGTVLLQRLEGSGNPSGAPTVVEPRGHALPDVEIARMGGGLVLAWTDARADETRVWRAIVDRAGVVTSAPAPVAIGEGDQVLSQLIARPGPLGEQALLLWEQVRLVTTGPALPEGGRGFRLARIRPDGTVDPHRVTIGAWDSGETPIGIDLSKEGIELTTRAPPCKVKGCAESPEAMWISLNRDLTPRVALPIRVRGYETQSPWVWGLRCAEGGCAALGAVGGVGAEPVGLYQFGPPRVSGLAGALALSTVVPPVVADDDLPRPRVGRRTAFVVDGRVAEISATSVADQALVAWITYANTGVPAPIPPTVRMKPGASAARDATISVRAIHRETGEWGPIQTLSIRGESAGGISVAAAANETSACVAWIARDVGDLQVFVTKIDPHGVKLAQKMLTHAKGDCSNVGTASMGDGWAIAWIDERDGHPEIYATRIGPDLRPQRAETRITHSSGEISDLALAVVGGRLRLAWLEAGGGGGERGRDIAGGGGGGERGPQEKRPLRPVPMTVDLRGDTLAPIDLPFAIAMANGEWTHLALARTAFSGLEGPGGPGAPGGSVRSPMAVVEAGDDHSRLGLVWLEGGRGASADSEPLALVGATTGVGGDCDRRGCRGVAVSSAAEGVRIQWFRWAGSTGGGASRGELLELRPAMAAEVPPVLIGDWAFFVDERRDGGGISAMKIAW